MADPRGFLKSTGRTTPSVRSRSAAPTGTSSMRRRPTERCARARSPRPPGAWTAASRSATPAARAARWATSSRSGTTSPPRGWARATDRLHATNNFPEFTGRLCPAPCEAACVLSITSQPGPVTIKRVEQAIADVGWADGHGGAPAAVDRARAGRSRSSVPARRGSPPRSSSPARGTTSPSTSATTASAGCCATASRSSSSRSGSSTGASSRCARRARTSSSTARSGATATVPCRSSGCARSYDAVVLAVGALQGRDDRTVEGRDLEGIHLAMEYLVPANRECEGDGPSPINARGKNVVIIGGGDTGADCYGTAPRQGAHRRAPARPVPAAAADAPGLDARRGRPGRYVLRTPPGAWRRAASACSPSRCSASSATRRGHVRAVELAAVEVRKDADGRREVVPTSEEVHQMPCDLVLFSIGFTGPDDMPLLPAPGPRAQPARARSAAARTGRPTPPGCSSAATPTAARR